MNKIKNNQHIFFYILTAFLIVIWGCQTAFAVRIKDLASIKGIRSNQLVGYGLVVGLDGTGDKSGSGVTMKSLANMMKKMGIHVTSDQLKVKNIASVMVTASLPPFARIGSKLDVQISSIGDAKSLEGGTLLLTPLRGVDNKVYALAQGTITFGAGGKAKKIHKLVARLPNAASIEREIRVVLDGKRYLTMSLFNPDFTTVIRVVKAINTAMGEKTAKAIDSAALKINIPEKMKSEVATFIAGIEKLDVTPDMVAKIVVNEKTGTVIIGENVTISTVAIAHGDLTITIKEPKKEKEQAQNQAGLQRNKKEEEGKKVNIMVLPKGSTIGDLVKALNAIGVKPDDLISIFQSIKASGALQAELEII